MYDEGDLVQVQKLSIDDLTMLSEALDANPDEIEFYFVTYESDDYVTLSAETETKFAIIYCPLYVLSMTRYREEIDRYCHQLLIDGAIDRKDKPLFLHLTDPTYKIISDDESRIEIGRVFEEDEDDYL